MEFRVLGTLEVWSQGRHVEISAPKQRALLALLLLNANQPLRRDVLINQIWEGSAPRSARTTLQSCVYRLRKLLLANDLDPNCGITLHTRTGGYLLEVPASALDLYAYEELISDAQDDERHGCLQKAVARLREALALWRDRALVDVDLEAVRNHTAALDNRRLESMEQCLRLELELGRHEAVVSELESLASQHPLRERLWEMLLTALYRCGRQAQALDTYQQVYNMLIDDLGIEPGRGLRELHRRILTNDPGLDMSPDDGAPDLLVPRQLANAVPDFVGREREFVTLDNQLRDTRSSEFRSGIPPVITITGTAGVGKTALALHWAHQVAGRFPDGQIYLNLRGFDPSAQAADPADLLSMVLADLGVATDQMPSGLTALMNLYRTILTGRHLLLLLDNARDTEQVRPLLPGTPECLVLVTSRHELRKLTNLDNATSLSLDLLTEAEANEFLARRLGWSRVRTAISAADDIAHHCARLPLAMAIVASRAASQPDRSLDSIAAELQATHGDLAAFADPEGASLRSTFSWSYRLVTTAAARLFRLLSLHPGADLSVDAAASLAGLPIHQTRRLLTELVAAHLVFEQLPARYACHDLLRAYAAELCLEQDSSEYRQTALSRLLDHYVHTGFAAALLLHPQRDPISLPTLPSAVSSTGLTDHRNALRWFTTERANLLSAIHCAADAGLHSQTWQLCWTVVEFLDRQGLWLELATVENRALDAAIGLADPSKLALAYQWLGGVSIHLHRHEEAHSRLATALEIFETLDDLVGQARTHRTYCWVSEQAGDRRGALEHAERALELFRNASHRNGIASALNDAGWQQAHLGDYQLALRNSWRALELFLETGSRNGQATAWETLGFTYHQVRDFKHAVACHEHALELYRDLGIRYYEAETLTNLGDTLDASSATHDARVAWREALHIKRELGRNIDDLLSRLAR